MLIAKNLGDYSNMECLISPSTIPDPSFHGASLLFMLICSNGEIKYALFFCIIQMVKDEGIKFPLKVDETTDGGFEMEGGGDVSLTCISFCDFLQDAFSKVLVAKTLFYGLH